jgi:cytochrome c1
MKQVAWTLAALLVLAAAAAAAVVWSGVYDVAANHPHLQPVHTLLETTMHRSVRRHARQLVEPADLQSARRLQRGAACYRQHCQACHGGPGTAVEPAARSMQPLPGPLVDAAARWKVTEVYWITRHGIKMSGMPAWQHRLDDDDLWSVTAFVQALRGHTAASYREAMAAAPPGVCTAAAAVGAGIVASPASGASGPDAPRGRTLFSQYACSACHVIPGVTGPRVSVGPPLAGLGGRALIAGQLPNTQDNLVRWLRDPASVDPGTAMPNMEVSERDAQDMAAYLRSLR